MEKQPESNKEKTFFVSIQGEVIELAYFFLKRHYDLDDDEFTMEENSFESPLFDIETTDFSSRDVKLMKKYYVTHKFNPPLYSVIDSNDLAKIVTNKFDYQFIKKLKPKEICKLLYCASYFNVQELSNLCYVAIGCEFYFEKLQEPSPVVKEMLGVDVNKEPKKIEDDYDFDTEEEMMNKYSYIIR